ncbi:hypothetical protein BZL29_7977 [Mycobacterium kansasii]|uniref:Uncharacterized protein n=1 Tax=Mycobacterium kansasii TaxID=1768 RepID=A0A1V3WE13_MYCKA|nr:hypothetical protein BZL29_7977 [Mycobacterium kansasii]
MNELASAQAVCAGPWVIELGCHRLLGFGQSAGPHDGFP